MDSCKFRKIICALGHSSNVAALDEPLPKKCPVCGQPYDRRYNIPVLCLEDGTVPEKEERTEQADAPDKEAEKISAGRRRYDPVQGEPAVQQPVMRARRRKETDQIPETDEKTEIALYSSGKKIMIPMQKKYLGRDGLGADIFMLNPLISRRHAQIYTERFGNVYVKDEDSLNGTFVDDGAGRRRLLPGETAELKAGDKLWLADQLLAIEKVQDQQEASGADYWRRK